MKKKSNLGELLYFTLCAVSVASWVLLAIYFPAYFLAVIVREGVAVLRAVTSLKITFWSSVFFTLALWVFVSKKGLAGVYKKCPLTDETREVFKIVIEQYNKLLGVVSRKLAWVLETWAYRLGVDGAIQKPVKILLEELQKGVVVE